jgi:hypothetical protein
MQHIHLDIHSHVFDSTDVVSEFAHVITVQHVHFCIYPMHDKMFMLMHACDNCRYSNLCES